MQRFTILIIIIILSSCSTVRKSNKPCSLNPATNTIVGNDPSQKELYVNTLFIPRLIEDLIKGTDQKYPIEYKSFFQNAKSKESKYTGYHIYGCADTIWAKKTMAQHIMKKFNVIRKDSSFLDTIYRLDVINENLLPKMPDDTEHSLLETNRKDPENPYKYCEGESFSFIASRSLPHEYHYKCNKVEFEDREGLYSLKVPIGIARAKGIEYYSKNYLEPQGLSMKLLRVDTVNIGAYSYRFSEEEKALQRKKKKHSFKIKKGN